MDRTSVKVLKYIHKKEGPVFTDQITAKFGDNGAQSLSMLCREGYLSRSLERTAAETSSGTKNQESEILSNAYYIEPLGRDFLEHRFENGFDKWLTRANGVLSILGGALLSKPLWAVLEWVWLKVLLLWDWICGLI